MDAIFESKLNMYRATENHCNDNAAITTTIPAFQTAVNQFKANIAAIIAAATEQTNVTTGVAIDKTQAKKTLATEAATIAGNIFAYAATKGNNELKQQANFTYTKLFTTKDESLAPQCQNIHQAASQNIAALASYGITAATLTHFQNTINNYQSKVPSTRTATVKKITAGKKLKTLFTQTDKILKEQMDKTVTAFATTNPDFVTTYKFTRVIIDAAKTKIKKNKTTQQSTNQ